MFPYRFAATAPDSGRPPAAAGSPTSDTRSSNRRTAPALVIALALLAGSVGGGAVGSIAAARYHTAAPLAVEATLAQAVQPQVSQAQPAPGGVQIQNSSG